METYNRTHFWVLISHEVDGVEGALLNMAAIRDYETIITIHRPDLKEKLFFFISGMVMSIPFAVYAETLTKQLCYVMPLLYARLCATALLTPFIEELAKAYPLFYRHGETERSILTLGFLGGLGYGITELLIHVLQLGATIDIARLTLIFLHAANTSIIAYGIAKNRPFLLYLVAVALHSINNIAAIFGLLWLVSGYPLLLVTFLIEWYLYRRTSDIFIKQKSH